MLLLLQPSRRAAAAVSAFSTTSSISKSSPSHGRAAAAAAAVAGARARSTQQQQQPSSSSSRSFGAYHPSYHSRRRTSLAVSIYDDPAPPPNNRTTPVAADGFSTMAHRQYDDDDDDLLLLHRRPTEMTEDERYLFDLNGFLIVRGVLTPDEVAACHASIDKHVDEAVPRSDPTLRNAEMGSPMYGTGPPRLDLGGILEWDDDDNVDGGGGRGGGSRVFKSILAHPRLVPIFHALLGKGYRLDHIPFVLMNDCGGEGFQLHGGTIDCGTGEYNSHLAYTCHGGNIRSNLLGCNVMLVDHDQGYGGFCVVPGSHKSNFRMPSGMIDGRTHEEYIVQPRTKAGDVVLFSEGTVHGALAWTNADVQRRCALYRFAPATMAYGRSYFGSGGGGGDDGDDGTSTTTRWPSKFYVGLDDAQRAVLEPPYANRLDRPNIRDDGTVEITRRSERKRQHDMNVFKTKYF